MRTLTEAELVDAVTCLRRTAIQVRAEGAPGWLTGALQIEQALRDREADLAALRRLEAPRKSHGKITKGF